MLTKIAVNKEIEFSLSGENEYLSTICGFCYDPMCDDNCILPDIDRMQECHYCTGRGLVKFLVQPADGGESYYVVTQCGLCDGLGLY